ncbi:hypothetical protein ABFT23_02160 [Nocardioides sp. C4-1]|uniref:hypothetical protein n=1 Tax=Nocardioides sp. C4-1 TaxID=3151851 RepID=UPI003266686B
MSVGPVSHWGHVGSALLFNPRRYGPYAAAHHVAGHHWARHRLSFNRHAAGLHLVQNKALIAAECERTAVVEASAVLVEALAIEAAVCADADIDFCFDLDVDWKVIRGHCRSVHRDARARGCRAPAGSVEALIGHDNWVSGTGRKLLRDWAGLAGLADLLGRGRVLEMDEVLRVLRR